MNIRDIQGSGRTGINVELSNAEMTALGIQMIRIQDKLGKLTAPEHVELVKDVNQLLTFNNKLSNAEELNDTAMSMFFSEEEQEQMRKKGPKVIGKIDLHNEEY